MRSERLEQFCQAEQRGSLDGLVVQRLEEFLVGQFLADLKRKISSRLIPKILKLNDDKGILYSIRFTR